MSGETRRVLITGANKGIGLAIARGVLAHDDDTVVLLGSRDRGRGEAAREALDAERIGWGARIEVVEVDVADDESVIAAASAVRGTHGDTPLFGLVNNAGIAHGTLPEILEVNTFGLRRASEAFLPLVRDGGRVVNVTSAAGPNFVADCAPERQRFLTDPAITWQALAAFLAECVAIDGRGESFEDHGLGGGNAYGLSKAAANAYTLLLAREHPRLRVNACTPGFIETDLTRPWAEQRGVSPESMGMKTPDDGARAPLHLLFGMLEGNGWYYGSDARRSPLDRYRSPGDPAYTGD